MAVHYSLRRSSRAKHLRLSVQAGGAVVCTAPLHVSESIIAKFLAEHSAWITKASQRMSTFKAIPVSGRRSYLAHKERARVFVHERLQHWNSFYGFRFNRIAIKDTKRLWGSCSRRGNLNFSYALLFLPQEPADYVVVHELCHLKEHNHSKAFWALVAKGIPNYLQLRRDLRQYIR